MRERIHGMILDGTFAPGDRLPRDEDLAGEFGCARSTVQRAMKDLADAGIVERRRRGGTRVTAHRVTRAVVDIPVIRQEVERSGAAYGYRLIRRAAEMPPPHVAAAMEAPAGAPMLHVEALHLSDRRPHAFEDRWISLATVPEIGDVDLDTESANEWLVRNRPYDRCDLMIRADGSDARAASVLDVPPGSALLVVDRATWIGERPITSVRMIFGPGYRLVSRG